MATATDKRRRAPMFGLCKNNRYCIIVMQVAAIVALLVAVAILAAAAYERYFYLLFNATIIACGLVLALSRDRWRRWNEQQRKK
jgi:uncharacterized membrane protein